MIVDGDDRATAADLATALGDAAAQLRRPDGALLEREASLLQSGLLDGDLLDVRSDASEALQETPEDVRWQVEVMDGPDTGKTFELATTGAAVVGRGPTSTVLLNDPEVSRRHACLRVGARGVVVEDLGSTNGTLLDGEPVAGPVEARDGAAISVGLSTMRLRRTSSGAARTDPQSGEIGAQQPASVEPDGQGGLLLNRVPSLRKPFTVSPVALPVAPRARERRPLPWLTAVIPLVFAGALYLITGTTSFLLFALLSPLTLAANSWTNRRAERRMTQGERAEYEEQRAAALARIDDAVRAELAWHNDSAPRGTAVADIAAARAARLWERSPGDADFLHVRVGTGNRPATVQTHAPAGTAAPEPELVDAPLTLPLAELGVLGVAGPPGERQRLARSLVIQLAGLHAADDLRLALFAESAAEEDWEFFRWLPHVWQPNERRLDIARSRSEVDGLVERLTHVLVERTAARTRADEQPLPRYVVVLEGASALRRRPEVAELLINGPRHGIYAIALDDDPLLVPEERRALVRVPGDGTVAVEDFVDGSAWSGRVDALDARAARSAAVRLAPIRRIGRRQGGGDLPNRLTLLEMLGERPTVESVSAIWERSRLSRPAIPVGRGEAGTFALDLVSSGPHALVGGTSGGGKSEFIQTWVASTALHLPPDECTFLFVEYKGLSAFLRLQHLPHCVGTITNLDPELTQRALTSLDAELKRRQRAFVKAEVSDISSYQAARRTRRDLPVMPRLLIVLDEFAEMKQDLPQFIDGLIRIARTGRSLGVHLILATQQVGRAVSGEITGNANLRVSFRAAVPDDSFALIECNDAARIPQERHGRAYAKRGEQPIEPFQAAWSAGLAHGTDEAALTAEAWAWNEEATRYQTVQRKPQELRTELEVVVETIAETVRSLGLEMPARPFTQPLPTLIPLTALREEAPITDLSELVRLGGPIVGRRDDPAAQIQEPYPVPLLHGHVAAIGSAQSGRTTLLRTAAASWAATLPPSMLEIHGVDGARALLSLATLPHVGTVAPADDRRTVRLLGHLAGEVNRRLDWLATRGIGELLEWWTTPEHDTAVPWIVLLIDRFEELLATIERGPAEASLERILTHGTAAGVTVLAAGDETLARVRWQSRFPTRLVLRNSGGMDSLQAGLPPRLALDALPPGRAYESRAGDQVQVAVVGSAATTAVQNEGLRQLGDELAERWGAFAGHALRLRELPQSVSAQELPAPRSRDGVVLGLGGDEAEPLELVARRLPLLVAGPDGSGRTETLRRVATAWAAAERNVIVLAADGTPLIDEPVRGVQTLTYARAADLEWEALLADPEAAVVVDDLHREDLPDSLVDAMKPQVPQCLFAGAMRGLALVPEPLLMLARRGTLLYLCPDDPRRLAAYERRVDASMCCTEPAGRGLLSHGRDLTVVQVATGPAQ